MTLAKPTQDLVALAKACLSREPEDRPRAAGAVAERVTAYLAGVQEKLRRADLERVEERARRRLTTVAAAAFILLGLAAGGGYTWNQQQKAARVTKTARAVDEALADAARLRGEAQAAPPGETARWAHALSAAKRAQGLLAQGEADAPLKGRVTALLAQLNREQAAAALKGRRMAVDRALLADLESIRGNRAEHGNLDTDRRRVRRRIPQGGARPRHDRTGRGGQMARGAVRAGGAGRLPRRLGHSLGEGQTSRGLTGEGSSQPRGRRTPTHGAMPFGPGLVPSTLLRSPSSDGWPTMKRPSTPSPRPA